MHIKQNQRGDTLVEVLISTVVLSIVLAAAFGLSTRALRLNQTATERTEVVNKMREQTEMLRFIHENRDGSLNRLWDAIVDRAEPPFGPPELFYFQLFSSPGNPTAPIVNPADLTTDPQIVGFIPVFDPALKTDSYGASGANDIFDIWIEPLPAPGGEYIDFIVRSEWEGIGGGTDTQSGASVLRLVND